MGSRLLDAGLSPYRREGPPCKAPIVHSGPVMGYGQSYGQLVETRCLKGHVFRSGDRHMFDWADF